MATLPIMPTPHISHQPYVCAFLRHAAHVIVAGLRGWPFARWYVSLEKYACLRTQPAHSIRNRRSVQSRSRTARSSRRLAAESIRAWPCNHAGLNASNTCSVQQIGYEPGDVAGQRAAAVFRAGGVVA